MPKNAEFFHDIRFFEKEFKGIMPVEIVVDTKTPKRVLKPATLSSTASSGCFDSQHS